MVWGAGAEGGDFDGTEGGLLLQGVQYGSQIEPMKGE